MKMAGGGLVSPCSCSGTQKWIHERCLREWRKVLRNQGHFRKAEQCEVCKSPYRAPDMRAPTKCKHPLHRALWRFNARVIEIIHSTSWHVLAYRMWSNYVLLSGIWSSVRLGVVGLRAGMNLGKALVEEQTSIMIKLMSTLADFLGAPYAQLLWCQAAAAVTMALTSEFVYTSLLGLIGGLAYGFCTGYYGAVQGTLRLLFRSCSRSAGALARGAVKAVRVLSTLLGRRAAQAALP